MIIGFIGLPGMGKTLGMVNKACRDLKDGKTVYSNISITDYIYGSKRTSLVYSNIIDNLRNAQNATFCIDEGPIVLPAHLWSRIDPQVLIRFAQARHFGLDIYYTSQGFNHTVKRLRDLTNYIVKCTHTNLYFKNQYIDPEYYSRNVPINHLKEYVVKTKYILRPSWGKYFKSFNTNANVMYFDQMTEKTDTTIRRYTAIPDTRTTGTETEAKSIKNDWAF